MRLSWIICWSFLLSLETFFSGALFWHAATTCTLELLAFEGYFVSLLVPLVSLNVSSRTLPRNSSPSSFLLVSLSSLLHSGSHKQKYIVLVVRGLCTVTWHGWPWSRWQHWVLVIYHPKQSWVGWSVPCVRLGEHWSFRWWWWCLPVLFRSTKVPLCLDRGVAGT